MQNSEKRTRISVSKTPNTNFWQKDINLKDKSTMHLKATVKDFFSIKDDRDLIAFYDIYNNDANGLKGRKIFALGEGSNTVFVNPVIDAVILKMDLCGYNIIRSNEDNVWVCCKSGVLFRDFVWEMCENNYSGLENLSGIYGTVGAAPVQNIGAYGMEVKDTIDSVRYFDMNDGKFHTISNKDCNFGYRNSIFKYQDGSKIISDVTFKLNKHFSLNTSYSAVAKLFEGVDKTNITPTIVCEKIKQLRNSKLPDPNVLGNCGSFFKNPVISIEHYEKLHKIYSDIVAFDDKEGKKIGAGWLIEKCGFKGKKIGGISMYDKQSLVLVNHGAKSSKELIDYAQEVIQTVKLRFDITLVAEPHFLS